MTDPVADMDKAVRCLYGAVDESVARDIDRRWHAVKAAGILVFKDGHPEHIRPVLCRLNDKYRIMRFMGCWVDAFGNAWNFPDVVEWAELP